MKIKYYLFVGLCCLCSVSLFAQMEVDHPIQLTGSGTNAKVTGIQSVTNTQDATSVGALQSGNFIFGDATGTSDNFILNVSPALNAYQPGMYFNFISNQTVIGPATLNINNLGNVSITKNVNVLLSGCEIENGQAVTVLYDGTNFQMISAPSSLSAPPTIASAGPDQLNVPGGETVTLAADSAISGTGAWTILSGSGGTVTNPANHASTFTGQVSTTYKLQWEISNSCGTSLDTVTISFGISCYITGSQTFSYSGALQYFTIPCGVYSLTITANGAQGGNHSGGEDGGYGAQIIGTVTVTPGTALTVLVGGQGVDGDCSNIANAGAGGGGGSFVYSSNPTTLLIAAGGGGGGALYDDGAPLDEGEPGQIPDVGDCGSESRSCWAGGCNGNNGSGGLGGFGWNAIMSNPNPGGGDFDGGYGGGGGYSLSVCQYHGAGGGGGYSGGGGSLTSNGCGNYGDGGGGGGSYNIGTNQTNTAGGGSPGASVAGNGVIIINW